MTDPIVRQVSRKAKQEPLEVLKTARSQIVGSESARSPVVNQIVTRDGVVDKVSDEEEMEIRTRTKKRIKELEEELEKIRLERKEKAIKWEKEQSEKMQSTKEKLGTKPLVELSTKPKRGILGDIKKRQGTREMGKGPSG